MANRIDFRGLMRSWSDVARHNTKTSQVLAAFDAINDTADFLDQTKKDASETVEKATNVAKAIPDNVAKLFGQEDQLKDLRDVYQKYARIPAAADRFWEAKPWFLGDKSVGSVVKESLNGAFGITEDMFDEKNEDASKKLVEKIPNDVARSAIKELHNGAKPSSLFTIAGFGTLAWASLKSKDGALHKVAMLFPPFAMCFSVFDCVTSFIKPFRAFTSAIDSVAKPILDTRRDFHDAKKAAEGTEQLGRTVAQLNTLTGHEGGTSVDKENAMSEFLERLRSGGLSEAELEGARAYFEDERRGHVGNYLADDMDGRPLDNLRGYRWGMGLVAALGTAAAAEFLINHGGTAGAESALSGAAAAAGAVASGAGSAAEGAMGAVGGRVSVMGIRGNLSSIVRDIMGNRSVLMEKTRQIEQLSAQLRQAMQGTNDTNMQIAFRQLEAARKQLDWANNMMLQQTVQYAQQFSDRL